MLEDDCDGDSSPVSPPETEDDLLLDSEGSHEECEMSSTSSTARAQSACLKVLGDIASTPAFPLSYCYFWET